MASLVSGSFSLVQVGALYDLNWRQHIGPIYSVSNTYMASPRISYQNGAICLEEIEKAYERLTGHAHVTPIFTSTSLNSIAGCQLYFKCEVFQKTGSFKYRGAFNAVASLSTNSNDAPFQFVGVVTHSSGNHGGALALAAKERGIPAYVVVPSDTPRSKQQAIAGYGATLVFCDPGGGMEARESTCARIQSETGSKFIHPYNFAPVICGQGTIGLELLRQVGDRGLDTVIVPVSGGGMISGIAVAAKSINPSIQIIAAEPSGTNDAADIAVSKAGGKVVELPRPCTICDGLKGRLGDLTWPIVRDLVDRVVVVSERQVIDAMKLCYQRLKVVVEPSGAAGLAAAIALKSEWQGGSQEGEKRVGVILCGGNVDFEERVPDFWDRWLIA